MCQGGTVVGYSYRTLSGYRIVVVVLLTHFYQRNLFVYSINALTELYKEVASYMLLTLLQA